QRGGNLLGSLLLRIPDDRGNANGCRPPLVGFVGNPRGPLRLSDRDPESGPSARRGPHGRFADRVLHSPRPGGGEVRRRNLETHGPDSTRVRRGLLESLLGRASEDERHVLLKYVFGEMRIGVNEGVMLEGISDASGVDLDSVRTAHMFLGDLGMIAEIALSEG